MKNERVLFPNQRQNPNVCKSPHNHNEIICTIPCSNPSRYWSLEWAWPSGLWWGSMWASHKGGEALSEWRELAIQREQWETRTLLTQLAKPGTQDCNGSTWRNFLGSGGGQFPGHFGHLMQRADTLEKTLMLGKIESRRRRATEDEMVGWHHQLNGHEFQQTLGDSEGQGSLLWGHKGLDWITILRAMQVFSEG